jgi:hypothetical protein
MILKTFRKINFFFLSNKLVIFFFFSHLVLAIFLGRMFAFAPDEEGYLFAFNNIYTLPVSTVFQVESGWTTAPTIFLWIAYLPAKIVNLMGVPDYLSIRLLSILLTTLSLFLLLRMNKAVQKSLVIPQNLVFISFFIPSVFFWTSTGLREAFIIFEISMFLAGINYLFLKKTKIGVAFLFASSYGLLSTKAYLWAVLVIAVFIFSLISFLFKTQSIFLIKLIAVTFVAPLILFTGTSSQNIVSYFFDISITEVGLRCGDSKTQIDEATFNDGSTIISLHFYFLENPNSAFSTVSAKLNLDDRVESLWNKKYLAALERSNEIGCQNNSSLNSSTLKPGEITKPWTMLWPAFVFLAGPFPLVGEPGIAAAIASFESPLWWLLYALVIFQFFRFKRFKLFRDPAILFTLIFLAGEIAFSSLVEVNLGTSFRHRSILLVPLVFLYVRITQRAQELSNADSKQTT